MQGNNFQIDKEPLINIPIRMPDENIIKNVAEKFDEINDENYNETIKEFDDIIYKIYNLSEYDIDIINNRF